MYKFDLCQNYSDDYKIFLRVLCHSVPLCRKEINIKAVIQRTKFKFVVYKMLRKPTCKLIGWNSLLITVELFTSH